VDWSPDITTTRFAFTILANYRNSSSAKWRTAVSGTGLPDHRLTKPQNWELSLCSLTLVDKSITFTFRFWN